MLEKHKSHVEGNFPDDVKMWLLDGQPFPPLLGNEWVNEWVSEWMNELLVMGEEWYNIVRSLYCYYESSSEFL